MRTNRINFLDLHFDRLSFPEVTDRLNNVTSSSRYRYIVTPNVDHVVRVHREPKLRRLYDDADLCVCDSRILRLLARARGIKLPLVAGSDLTSAVFDKIIVPGDRIAIVGAESLCVEQLRAKLPETEFIHYQAPMNLRTNAAARSAAAEFIASSGARFAFIAVGSPQQEMIAHEVRQHPSAIGVGFCIGAGLDFITGKQKRAPRFLQNLGLEWAHRLLLNPRRLWRRYIVEGLRIFPIWLRWRAPSGRSVLPTICVILAALSAIGVIFVSSGRQTASSGSLSMWLPPPAARSAAAVQALPPPDLLKPLTPDQAAKENAERPFAVRPDSPASRFILRTDSDDRARAVTCLAQAIYYEAAGEGVDGGRAVAQVVLNRVRHPGFPSTICGVVYEGADRQTGCQFSFTCDGSMQRIPIPSLWARSKLIAEEALRGRVFAAVGHATHYHADYVLPYWADSLDKSVQLGHHIFYRLRSTYGDSIAFSQRYGGAEPAPEEPGASIVIPQTPEGEQFADKLIGAQSQYPDKKSNGTETPPATPLLIDSAPSTLLADEGASPAQPRRSKQSNDCAAATDSSQFGPLKANDMRSTASSAAC